MVALLHPENFAPTPRPRLRLVQGGDPERIGARVREHAGPFVVRLGAVFGVLIVAVLTVASFGLLQGDPPASTWDGVQRSHLQRDHLQRDDGQVVVAAPMDEREQVRVVQAGDTLWEIALELAPNADPRPLVDAMAKRNGGSTLRVGQDLIVPVATSS